MHINFRSQNVYTFELYGHIHVLLLYNELPEAIFVVYW